MTKRIELNEKASAYQNEQMQETAHRLGERLWQVFSE
jgi:hypothetical protein